MNKKVAVFIPVRMGATRLPGKPLAMIGDKPMIVHVMHQAIKADIGPVYVACQEQEIADIVRNFGGNAILTDAKHQSGSDRIAEALEITKDNIDIVVNLQGDLPLIDPEVLKLCPNLISSNDVDIGTFAAIIKDEQELKDPNVVKIAMSVNDNGNIGKALYFSRSVIPYNTNTHYHHIGIYVYQRQALERFISLPMGNLEKIEKLEQLRALEHGMKIDVAIVNAVPKGVDSPNDLELVRNLYKKMQGN